jgi:hypothetical protein
MTDCLDQVAGLEVHKGECSSQLHSFEVGIEAAGAVHPG